MIHARTTKGFTLVETLVAITIIVTAILGPLYAVQQALAASRIARDQLIASSLAQEAVEYVRARRDNIYLYNLHTPANRFWLYGFNGQGGPDCLDNVSAPCYVDPVNNFVTGSARPLYINPDGVYNQLQSGTASPFTRTVQLTTLSATEVELKVRVTWSTRGVPHETEIVERIHNWL